MSAASRHSNASATNSAMSFILVGSAAPPPTPPRGPAPGSRLPSLQRLGDQLRDVLDLQLVLRALHLPPEVHHREAERTGRAHRSRLCLEQLCDADLVHALLAPDLHPHVSAAAAAAEALVPVPRRIDHLDPRNRPEALPRRVVDVV